MSRAGLRAVVVGAALAVLACGCGNLPTPRPSAGPPATATTTTAAAATPTVDPDGFPTSFGRGIYDVGVDIAPGTYRTGPSSSCYWSRSVPGPEGRGREIVEDVFDRPEGGVHRVTLAEGERFNTSRCGIWDAE
ncbi:hypothetical protein [Pseudonocardia sp.]|uniref:hypothetical protein n=1 Tax=Pseudonocardia sp. TaxID=60912 RepID=UPI0026049F5F|nr:hypothetical protein [Pseudonocardia sp.]